MIEFKQVSKVYRHQEQEVQALKQLDLVVADQEILGVVGQSGSGKSTFLKLLNQMEPVSSGELLIDGVDISRLSGKEQRLFRKKVGMIFQQFNLLTNLTVYDNVALPLKLIGVKDEEKVNNLLSFVGMSDKGRYFPSQLSGGESQRVAVARALISEPSILLCDEPTSALDPQNAAEIVSLLKQVNREYQTTVIVVSHDFDVIKQLCQRSVILDKGQLIKVVDIRPQEAEPVFENYYERAVAALS